MRTRSLLALALVCAVILPGAPPAGAKATLRVGSLVLHPCAGAWCGSMPRPLDPTITDGPTIRIGFTWYPASGPGTPDGTIMAVEGGPGWPSTGSSVEYRRLFASLLTTRNLLLIDDRGTGRSAAIDCPALQHHPYPAVGHAFERLVGACGRTLNHTWRDAEGRWIHASDLFATPYAVADSAAVVGALGVAPLDLYGDSYGTWFVRAFLSRHADMLRSVVLDSSYPMFAGGPWYRSSYRTARSSLRIVCRRDPACTAAAGGDSWARVGRLVTAVRAHPLTGTTRDPASGQPMKVRLNARTMVDLVANAGFDPIVYRELDAAVRAALGGDAAPILRLVALAATVDNLPPRPVSWYSDGLYFAASCTDYAQLYDMDAPITLRHEQLRTAIGRAPAGRFSPFSPGEWARMDNYSETYTGCLDWPRPVPAHAVRSAGHGPPLAPPDLPVLMVTGELDSWTSPLMKRQMLREIGPSARFVLLANSVHTASEGDVPTFASTLCGTSIVQAFVADPDPAHRLDTSCAGAIPPIHTPGAFPLRLADARPASVAAGSATDLERRAATVAAQALGDTLLDWYVADGSRGAGLRGGHFAGNGSSGVVTFHLDHVRWVGDATVSGHAVWNKWSGEVTGTLRVRGPGGLVERVRVAWDNDEPMASVRLDDGTRLVLPAP